MSLLSLFVFTYLLSLSLSLYIEWKQTVSKLPIPLTQACVCTAANDTIYIFGGYTSDQVPSQNVYSFNPSTDIMETLNITTPTNEFICNQNAVYSAITNKIYIIGIYTNDTNDWKHTTFNYEFDPVTLEFTSIPNAAYPLKQSCVAITSSLIFAYGGFSYDYHSTLYTYNILTKQWTQKTNTIDRIFNGACYATNDTFYSFGGWNPDSWYSITGGVINHILRYDIKTDAWYEANTLSYYKWHMKAVSYFTENIVLLVGGYGLTYEQRNTFKMEAYDYKNNVVISDVSSLQTTQGGACMITSYMDGIIMLGGNSYDTQNVYDAIYYIYIPTQLPTTMFPSDTLAETTLNMISYTSFSSNTSETIPVKYTTTGFTASVTTMNQDEIVSIALIIGIIILGSCVIIAGCYMLYKRVYNKRDINDIEQQNNNHNVLELPKKHTITVTPPGINGVSIQRYLSVDREDRDETSSSDIDVNGAREGVPDVMDAKEDEILRAHAQNDDDSMSDSERLYVMNDGDMKAEINTPDNKMEYDLKHWLAVNGMAHYVDNFLLHGYDSLEFVRDIHDVKELIDIGIIRKADQHKLISLIRLQLQLKDNNGNMTTQEEEGENVEMHVQITCR